MLDEYISVSELNLYIKTYLENNYFLQDVYVKGEISNFKRHQSGTLYFAIKDEKCSVNIVMFSNYASKLKVSLKDGDLVLIKGRISVYEARGTYSINASEIIFDSKGMLLIQFEELKQRLYEEGLFDPSVKKQIPKFPNKIGLITAPYGAAVQDMLRTIKHRWPIAQVYIYPSLVQGNDAKYDIVKNIKLADKDNLDVIICGRGGGSIEDLWPFNEEIVARAFYECNTPIISAVGHEIDTTISDYVADARGLTPTDGAIKATSDIKDVITKVNDLKNQLNNNMLTYLKMQKANLDRLSNSYILLNPTKIYENYRYKIDELESTLINKINTISNNVKIDIIQLKESVKTKYINVFNEKKNKLSSYAGVLDSLSPLKVLNRGYSFASKDDKIIKSINDININETVKFSFSDGSIDAIVKNKEKH